MKRLVLAFCYFLTCFAAFQPAAAEPWTVGAQSIAYPYSGSTYTGVLGDGSTPNGGTPPAIAYEPADIPDNFTTTDWLNNGGGAVSSDQAKIRFKCVPSHVAQEDPIVYPGQAKKGHLHMFFGNTLTNKDSDYTSLRTTGGGTCSGGPLNRTGYWIAAMMAALPSGATAPVKFDQLSGYYTINGVSTTNQYQRFFRDFSYIGGVDPNNFNSTCSNTVGFSSFADYSACGGTMPGGGFAYGGGGLVGWYCYTGTATINTSFGTTYAPYFAGPNGQDPWAGQCKAGDEIVAVLNAPGCWDGHNLHSPDGRSHVKQTILFNGVPVCPDHWFKLPVFEGSFFWSLKTDAEYLNWHLSSDWMLPANTPGDPSSIDPCRKISAHYCGGATAHFDWKGAWSYGTKSAPSIMAKLLANCLGITLHFSDGDIPGSPMECDENTIDGSTTTLNQLKTGTPPDTSLAPNPIIDMSTPRAQRPSVDRYFPVQPGDGGMVTMEGMGHTSMNDVPPPPSNDNTALKAAA